MIRKIEFIVTKLCRDKRAMMRVHPTFENIKRDRYGELMLLSIAANCLVTLGRQDGLEAALERLIEVVMSRTQIHPEK